MLERERGVVSNEKRQGENQPYGRAFSRMFETMYPYSHPYSWPVIGSIEDLQAATLDDVKQWYATYYGPNNAVLSLAGDITVDRAKELVTKYFNGIAPGPALPRTDEWIPKLERNIRDSMEDRVPQTRIYRVWNVAEYGQPDLDRLQLLAQVLGGSKSSRLDKRLLFDDKLVETISAGAYGSQLGSSFLIQAEGFQEAINLILEISRAEQDVIDRTEREKKERLQRALEDRTKNGQPPTPENKEPGENPENKPAPSGDKETPTGEKPENGPQPDKNDKP